MMLLLHSPWSRTDWDANLATHAQLTNDFIPALEAITPGSGAYLNEADFDQPNWQETFWGDKYSKLRSIKNKYDPETFFYARKGVGSESLKVSSDGRLCQV
jgi:hypothetical protein